jgi:hypothetical protein
MHHRDAKNGPQARGLFPEREVCPERPNTEDAQGNHSVCLTYDPPTCRTRVSGRHTAFALHLANLCRGVADVVRLSVPDQTKLQAFNLHGRRHT